MHPNNSNSCFPFYFINIQKYAFNNILNSGRAYGSTYDKNGNVTCHVDNYGYVYDKNGNYAGFNVYY